MISPESWGFSSIPQLANVGIVFACGSYTGSHTLSILDSSCNLWLAQHWHTCCYMQDSCQHKTGTDVATHAKPMPTLAAPRVGTLVATQGSCQLSDKCWTGGGCWLVLTIVVASQTQNRWKLGILPRVLTTVSYWLALRLLQVAQQWKNSLTFV